MKKLLAILLSVSLLLGACVFSFSASALQFPKISDKINEYNECFSNSASDGIIYATVYYNNVVPMPEEEKELIVYQRSGISAGEVRVYSDNYRNLTDEEKKIYQEKLHARGTAYWNLVSGLADQNAAPFLEQMGITLQYNNKNVPIYHNRRVIKNETSIDICLTKAEVLQAAELDYAEGIICNRRGSKNPYRTILFKNNLNWENVYLYSYDWNGKDINGEFPGKLVEDKITDEYGDEYYAIDIPINTQEIILSNGSNQRTYELYILEIIWGDYYAYYIDETSGNGNGQYSLKGFDKCYSTDDPDTPGDGNFVLTDNLCWKEAYIYATDKDGNELYGAFPGKQAKRFLDYGGYQFQITVPEGAASIVVSNSKGKKTVPITYLSPDWGYSLGSKDQAGNYTLDYYYGYLPEPGGEEDEWLEPDPEPTTEQPTTAAPEVPEPDYIKFAFEAWSVKNYGEDYLQDGYNFIELYTHYNGDKPDWVLCQANYSISSPMITWLKIGGIGGRCIINNNWDYPFMTGYGVYDVNANEFYGLEDLAEAYVMHNNTGHSSAKYEGLTDALAQLNIGCVTGDANKDNRLDILDSTFIQKVASGKAEIDYDDKYIMDVNNDNTVDILDATLIQKSLVS